MFSQQIFYILHQLRYSFRHTSEIVRNLPTLMVSILLVVLVYQLTWVTVLNLAWLGGACVLLSLPWLGVQGSFSVLSFLSFSLLFKTLVVWSTHFLTTKTTLVTVGDYALLSDNYVLQLQFLLDSYSLSYILLTSVIGFWALLFATNYMRGEPRILNFLILLYFFLLSMILLLASGNFPTLMLGWELIGCFSFLLINFWTTRVGTAKSAFKAFFFNKLSDAALIAGLLVLVIFIPSGYALSFTNIFLLQGSLVTVAGISVDSMQVFILSVIVCSFCKSAQFGFHAWLPDSMEAPVPASALIHSATLVSAGIFLLGRHEILTSLSWANSGLILWCSFTALYGGVVAAYQTDLKKILAYSTISHCGFLFLLVVYNNFLGLVLYLHLHGWFKSYSFMAAGNIITKFTGYQDYRRMGGGVFFNTLESLVLVISICCLGGLPFLLGFFNKHYLLLLAYEDVSSVANIFILGAAFTGLFYSIKTISNVFFTIFKNTNAQLTNLSNGMSLHTLKPSEPTSNVVLLAFYPLFISTIAALVINHQYWLGSVVYHSIFGIFFFYIYGLLASSYFKSLPLGIATPLIFVKVLYVSVI